MEYLYRTVILWQRHSELGKTELFFEITKLSIQQTRLMKNYLKFSSVQETPKDRMEGVSKCSVHCMIEKHFVKHLSSLFMFRKWISIKSIITFCGDFFCRFLLILLLLKENDENINCNHCSASRRIILILSV